MHSATGGKMGEKITVWDFLVALICAIAAIAGCAGGCLVAVRQILRGKHVTLVIIIAYSFVGAVFGVAGVLVLGIIAPVWESSLDRIVLAGLLFGVIGAAAIAMANLAVRFTLPFLGKELQIEIREARQKRSP